MLPTCENAIKAKKYEVEHAGEMSRAYFNPEHIFEKSQGEDIPGFMIINQNCYLLEMSSDITGLACM
jgi:hypothetical protein